VNRRTIIIAAAALAVILPLIILIGADL